MTLKTDKQIREMHIKAMGSDLGKIYNELMNDVVWLHVKWSQYRQLFGKSPARIELLNATAGTFFYVIQNILMDDVLLHLARLTDKPKSCGKKNLSILTMANLISIPILTVEVKKLAEIAYMKCKNAREWRNRRIAHHDFHDAMVSIDESLPGISRDYIETALDAIRVTLNRIENHFFYSEVWYQDTSLGPLDGDSLITYLQTGYKAEQEKLERLRNGQPLREDFENDEYL
jgi:hypothetical protein